jgi:hypothetical protein
MIWWWRRPATSASLDERARGALGPEGLCLLGFLVCLSYAWIVEERPPSDVAEYEEIAVNLLSGKGYVQEPGFRAFRLPGLVLYLATWYGLFGPYQDGAVRVVQCFFFAVLIVFACRLGRGLLGVSGAFAVGLMMALSHELIFWAGKPATEFLYTFLLTAALLLLTRFLQSYRPFFSIAAGVVLGMAAMTRPIPFAIAPLWGLGLAWEGRRARLLGVGGRFVGPLAAPLLFLGPFVVVVAPWFLRNSLLFGRPVLTTSSGLTLWWANHPTAEVGGWYGVVWPRPGPWVQLKQGISEVEINDALTREAWGFIRRDPERFVRLAFGRIGFLLLGSKELLTNVPFDRLEFWPGFEAELLKWNLGLLVLSCLGLLWVVRKRERLWWPGCMVLAGSLAVHLVYTSVPRMRVPLLPVLFLLSIRGAFALWEMLGGGTAGRSPADPPESPV